MRFGASPYEGEERGDQSSRLSAWEDDDAEEEEEEEASTGLATSLRRRGARRAAPWLRLPVPPPARCARRSRSMSCLAPISPRRRLLFLLVALSSIPGSFSSRLVTLDTIDIFTTHGWFHGKPIVYFRCNGDNKTYLPDVKEVNSIYTFKGEESWQPLTELPEKKCKRCGLYEEVTLRNGVFDEWEMCSSDFKDGKYAHFKENQFNATFLCSNCTASIGNSGAHDPSTEVEPKKTSILIMIVVSVLVSVIVIIALFGGYKYWHKRKRERDQLRFLKLFEEGDDLEDELDLSNEL